MYYFRPEIVQNPFTLSFSYVTDSVKREKSLDFAWLSKYINDATRGRVIEGSSQNCEINGQVDESTVCFLLTYNNILHYFYLNFM